MVHLWLIPNNDILFIYSSTHDGSNEQAKFVVDFDWIHNELLSCHLMFNFNHQFIKHHPNILNAFLSKHNLA